MSNTPIAVKMSRLSRLTAAVAAPIIVSACAGFEQHPPPSVQAMPLDCVNRVAITNWYQTQLAVPRPAFQSPTAYENNQAQIRYRIWHLRYHCQPV